MKNLWTAAVGAWTVVLALPSSALAEPDASAFVRTRVGAARAPFYLENVPEARSEFTQAVSFIVGGELRLERDVFVGFRLGAAPSLLAQPGGSYVNDRAFGNLELAAGIALPGRQFRAFAVKSRVAFALGAPIAGHGPRETLNKNRVVAISAALEGWRDQELYVPGAVPLTPRAEVVARRGRLELAGQIELPVFVRVSTASIGERGNERALGFVPGLTTSLGVWAARFCRLSVGSHVAAAVRTPVEQPGGVWQWTVEPRVDFEVGGGVGIRVDTLAAVGGPLAGTVGIGLGLAYRR